MQLSFQTQKRYAHCHVCREKIPKGNRAVYWWDTSDGQSWHKSKRIMHLSCGLDLVRRERQQLATYGEAIVEEMSKVGIKSKGERLW